jgi:hypothetical protein
MLSGSCLSYSLNQLTHKSWANLQNTHKDKTSCGDKLIKINLICENLIATPKYLTKKKKYFKKDTSLERSEIYCRRDFAAKTKRFELVEMFFCCTKTSQNFYDQNNNKCKPQTIERRRYEDRLIFNFFSSIAKDSLMMIKKE